MIIAAPFQLQAAGRHDDARTTFPTVVTARVNEVRLAFTAFDKRGKPVHNLDEDDVSIRDDGMPPEAVYTFSHSGDMPLYLGLIIDTSSSVSSRFDFERLAAARFLSRMIRPGVDKAFVLGFNSAVLTAQASTDDMQLLVRALRNLENGGGTALYDAIYSGVGLLTNTLPASSRHAIVVISDGEDNQSAISRATAIAFAQNSEATIYAISTNITGSVLPGDRALEQITSETGGCTFFPRTIRDIDRIFRTIESELRSEYLVSYKPAKFKADGRFHSVNLSSRRKGVRFHCRRGYFAIRP